MPERQMATVAVLWQAGRVQHVVTGLMTAYCTKVRPTGTGTLLQNRHIQVPRPRGKRKKTGTSCLHCWPACTWGGATPTSSGASTAEAVEPQNAALQVAGQGASRTWRRFKIFQVVSVCIRDLECKNQL